MITAHNRKRIVAGAVLSATVALAGFGLGTSTAEAKTRGP